MTVLLTHQVCVQVQSGSIMQVYDDETLAVADIRAGRPGTTVSTAASQQQLVAYQYSDPACGPSSSLRPAHIFHQYAP